MKRKKKYLIIMLCLFLFSFIVNTGLCDVNKISINAISMDNKSDNVDELDDASFSGKNINLNVSMSEVGDNIQYRIVVNNDSDDDFEIDESSFNFNTDYVNYTFEPQKTILMM